MNDVDEYLRGIATARLLELTYEVAVDSDPEDEVRWAYVRELHRRPEQPVFDAARSWCDDESFLRRMIGADLLGQLGSRERDRPFLLESQRCLAAMIDDPEPEVVAAAITALSHFSQNLNLPRVIEAADHSEADVRRAVAVCLGGEASEPAVAALVALSSDDDEEVRSWATFGLGSQCDVDTAVVRQALVDRLDEPDHEIRGEALVGLARRADPRVIEPLAAELGLDSVATLAVEAAAEMPSPRFTAALEERLERQPEDRALTEALRRCREEPAAE